ncbi:MAG: chaperone modulator CbpM [Cecembia sp.]
MIRIYKDLGLIPLGLDMVIGLLDRIQDLQEEIRRLKRNLGKLG